MHALVSRSRLPHVAFLLAALLLMTTGLPACAPAPELVQRNGGANAQSSEAEKNLAHENLHSTLYVQTAAEYAALTRQAWRGAEAVMRRGLRDSTWTAFPPQETDADYLSLPPAVVVDVDETVLDNSPFQARLVLDDASYDLESWNAWVREEKARPVPGALAFAQAAADAGVTVVYLTNRRAEVEPATRGNLRALGFPLGEGGSDVIYTRGEAPFEDTSDKAARRRAIAERYRILLFAGDNLGDFVSGVDRPIAERRQLVEQYQNFWGRRWIVLPNPEYGSWEGALYDYQYDLSPAEKLRRKREKLRTARGGS